MAGRIRRARRLTGSPGQSGPHLAAPRGRTAKPAVDHAACAAPAQRRGSRRGEHLRACPAEREQYVFRTATDGPLSRSISNSSVRRPAVEAAGLVGVGMHDLRHFYASALIRAGLNPKVVATRLGHASAAMTLNTYSHLWPDDEDRTRQAIDDVPG
ncbi:MAG TPA: tyrosine-type recombinase/integrase [Micromonospora sp.]